MKNAKLVIGILAIVTSLIVLFQSCAAGLLTAIARSDDAGGAVGLVVSIAQLVCGIILIVTRENPESPAIPFVFAAAAVLSQANNDLYRDLAVWGFLLSVYAVVLGIIGVRDARRDWKNPTVPAIQIAAGALSAVLAFTL